MGTWSFLARTHFLDIFSLDMSQISSNLLKKAFGTRQHAFLFTRIVFYDIFTQVFSEIKILREWPVSWGFLIFFFLAFPSSFFFICYKLFFYSTYLQCVMLKLLTILYSTYKTVLVEEKVVIHCGRCNNKVYYRLSHDVVTWDVDRDVSTAYC